MQHRLHVSGKVKPRGVSEEGYNRELSLLKLVDYKISWPMAGCLSVASLDVPST